MEHIKYDVVVVGCGFAGATAARVLAERGRSVLVIEQRSHVAGNCYDEKDPYGILVHTYGPHIFHTNQKKVYDFLSRFTKWYDYQHEVVGNVYGKYLPIPFNLNTLHEVYEPEKASRLETVLLQDYGEETRVPILKLRESDKEEIRELAEYVYENVFLHYTMKQWGQKPEEVDQSVTARVPVVLSRDNRYFQDAYQGMPLEGYTSLVDNMLSHEKITVCLNTSAKERLTLCEGKTPLLDGCPFEGAVIYTGAVDELFDCCYGRLPYRSLDFVFEHYEEEVYQPKAVVNYTVSEAYTRITEFKYLTGQKADGTTIMKEYSKPYQGKEGEIPYYAILNEENNALYNRYKEKAESCGNVILLGRLAEYKYYNIDAIVERAMEVGGNLS
ncbi:MAG: UDP-galactopyranose mutase [Clostridiales bacterium]|nr:UDP-galactopyranose mutase [Clostridiales bacterium]